MMNNRIYCPQQESSVERQTAASVMSRLSAILLLIVVVAVMLTAQTGKGRASIDIRTVGAVGNGSMNCAEAIQHAVDSLHRQGGGIVIVPKGIFLTGSIELRSGVELQLRNGAVLLGAIHPMAYRVNGVHRAMIYAEGANDIAVTGHGRIDGRGLELALTIDSLHHAKVLIDPNYNYYRMRPSEAFRPNIINFYRCTAVRVTGVEIRNGAGWVTKFQQCRGLTIDRVSVVSRAYWNNDGIDLVDCKRVAVTNCTVNSADDGICLKSSDPNDWNDSIFISTCTIRSSANAVKFGTDSKGGFKNIRVSDITVLDTYRSAVAIEVVDGGTAENIIVERVSAKNVGNALFIRLGRRDTTRNAGVLRNVKIQGLRAEIPFGPADEAYDLRGPGLSIIHNPIPASITGIPGYSVENVTLEDIEISYPGRGTKGMAYIPLNRLDQVPEREKEYPEFSMFGELPAWGMYVRHASGLTLKNVTMSVRMPDYRPPVVLDDVHTLSMTSSRIGLNGGMPSIVVRNVRTGTFTNVQIGGRSTGIVENIGSSSEIRVN